MKGFTFASQSARSAATACLLWLRSDFDVTVSIAAEPLKTGKTLFHVFIGFPSARADEARETYDAIGAAMDAGFRAYESRTDKTGRFRFTDNVLQERDKVSARLDASRGSIV